MKEIKLIVTDLDGTILNHGEFCGTKDIETLIEAQNRGYKVVIATGQSWVHASVTAKKLDIDKNVDLIICNNGSIVSKVSNYEPIKIEFIDQKTVEEIINVANKYESCVYAFSSKQLHAYHNGIGNYSKNEAILEWEREFGLELITPKTKFENILQVMVFPKPDLVQKFENEIFAKFSTLANISPNDSEDVHFYEFNSINGSKGKGLTNLLEILNLTKDEVIVFGDNQNDLSMFKEAKYSVAVNNATQVLKDIALFTTDSNKENGVSKFIEENLF